LNFKGEKWFVGQKNQDSLAREYLDPPKMGILLLLFGLRKGILPIASQFLL
jgi:hypothetical protein